MVAERSKSPGGSRTSGVARAITKMLKLGKGPPGISQAVTTGEEGGAG
jgi:hypothetical protein